MALSLLSSPLIAVPHGFGCRLGGVSSGIFTSCNVGYGLGDEDGRVAENRRRLASALDTDSARCQWMKQIHSATVLPVSAPSGEDLVCDGLVTAVPDLALFVKTADCVPLLLWDGEQGVVAALHAGWRGTVADIAGEGVRQMALLGAKPANIRAAIGPCIRSCCYEVDEPFVQAVTEARGSDFARRFITDSHGDLIAMNRFLLETAGVLPSHIDTVGDCTCCHPDTYFSHRYSHGQRGVMGAGIRLPREAYR